VSDFSLEPCLLTTQILPHDDISRLMREIVGVNQVVLDLDQDMWRYISDDWFVQQVIAGQVGSSTMPQKVNPRFFENSEGNLKKAKALFEEVADDLQVSRLQRDLSGSTIQRDYGLPLAWTILGYEMAITNLNRLSPNAEKISSALDEHPEIISEAIQTILRREGVLGAYEKIRDFVRGKEVTLDDLHNFVKSLNLSDDVEKEILSITPQNYLGNSIKLTEMFVDKKI
jgi:adenylosuccinate lyase